MSMDELAALADMAGEGSSPDTGAETVADEGMNEGDVLAGLTGAEDAESDATPQEEPFEFANMRFPGGKRQAEEGIQNLYNELQAAQQRNQQLTDALRQAIEGRQQPTRSGPDVDPLDEHVQAIMETAALNDPKRFLKEQLKRMQMIAAQAQQKQIDEGLERRVQEKFSVFAPYVLRDRFLKDPNMADIHDSADEFAYLMSQGLGPDQAAAFIRGVKTRGKPASPVSTPSASKRSPGLESPGRGSPGKTKKASEDEIFKKLLGQIYD